MAFFSWSRWLRSLLRPQTKPIHKRTSRLTVEALEPRLTPTQFIWTGSAGDGNLGTAGNWQGNAAPSATSGVNDLIFPPVSGSTKLVNNIGTGTSPLKVNSITFSGNNYSITGNTIVLGATSGTTNSQTGEVNVGAGLSETLGLGMTLGGGGTSQQDFIIGAGATLTVSGSLSGTAGAGWEQTGSGTMILSADNTSFTGAFTVAGGVTQIQSGTALGISAVASNVVTVQTGAQLQLDNPNGINVHSHIRLNGDGPAATGPTAGAILNLVGNNTWTGEVELDSNVALGSAMPSGSVMPAPGTVPWNAAPWNLTFTGQITDLGAGHGVSKEGAGTITFDAANAYRGTTTIDQGILAVENSQALGTGPGGLADDSSADAVIVNANYSNNTYGTLQLVGPNAAGAGLTIANKLLILNGPGAGTTFIQPGATSIYQQYGALDNAQGNNTWTGNVILGSDQANGTNNIVIRADGTDPHFKLTLTGVVSDPHFTAASGGKPAIYHNLAKNGAGVVVFTNSNTYGGTTDIWDGTLQIDDSQALGPKNKTNATTVHSSGNFNASLQLAVDNIPDSLTGTRNTLTVFDPLNISGPGDGGIGALSSLSGINIYYGTVTLQNSASIGVTADPNPTNTAAYFTNDYSLTIEPSGGVGTSAVNGGNGDTLTKVGTGQLILPSANTNFTGNVDINAGWITAENNNSLGTARLHLGVREQPLVTIRPNAALMLDAPTGTTLNLPENFVISGTGITHPFSEIDQQGAIENIAGANSIEGNIEISGPAGIGVEPVFGPSQLALLGEISQPSSTSSIPVGAQASGGSQESDTIVDTGSTSGTITISYNMYYIPDTIDVYYGVKGAGGIDIKSTGPLQGTGVLPVSYAPIGTFSTTTVEIVIDQGGGLTSTFWTYSAVITPAVSASNNSLAKLGSGLLTIQGDNTFTGPVNIDAGVLLNQNNTGLGAGYTAGSTTTVAAGAALALANNTAYNNGGLESGITVNGEQLVLNSNPDLQTVTVNGSLFGTFALSLTVGGNTATTGALAANIPAAQPEAAIASATESGTTVTITTSTDNNFQTGELVTIAGITPSGYDGTFQITAIDPTQFTYTAPAKLPAASLSSATATLTGTSTSSLQNALQGLLTNLTGANGGTVTVTQNGDTYDLVYGGTLAGTTPTLTVASGSVTSPSTNVIIGTGIGNSTLGAPVAPLSVFGSPTSPWNPNVTLFQSSNFLAGLTTTTLAPYGTVGSNTIIPTDVQWNGGVTMGGSSYIDVPASTRLIIGGAINDTNPSDLIKVGAGELTLDGVSSYRGSTYVGTSGASSAAGFNPDGANQFFENGGPVPGGVLTAASNQALGDASMPTVQQLTFTNPVNGVTQFQLLFNSAAAGAATTGPNAILYTGNPTTDALAIQNALNALPNIGGASSDPDGQVTVVPTSTPGQFTITFGGSFAGFNQALLQPAVTSGPNTGTAAVTLVSAGTGGVIVQNSASLQLEGNITIAGKTLEMSGQGFNPGSVPLVTPNWSSVGAGPVTNGPTIETGQVVNGVTLTAEAPTAGRITGIAVDPTDPTGNTIYVATAGGGAFKTLNDGQTWVPIFQNANALDLGAIAVAPSDPHVIYIGTGEADNSPDSYAGIGVYESTDDGHTWTLLTNPSGSNPINGLSVSSIAVDTYNPNLIYVGTGDQSTNAKLGIAVPGVYRYDGTTWVNLTAQVSPNRASNAATSGGLPGPDDNYSLNFPQQNVTWSDVGVVSSTESPQLSVLYAALGSADGTWINVSGTETDVNGIYYMLDPVAAAGNLAWDLGSGGANAGDAPQVPGAGVIKFNAVDVDPDGGPSFDPLNEGGVQIQAVVESGIQPQVSNAPPAPDYITNQIAGTMVTELTGQFGAGKLPDGEGMVYNANKPIIPANGDEEYDLAIYTTVDPSEGQIANALGAAVYQVNTYIGTETNFQYAPGTGAVKGGVSFIDITEDTNGNSPHASFHAIAGIGNVLFAGTDGGIWEGQLNGAGGLNTWTDINGNLNNLLAYSVSSNPNTPGNILVATQSASIAQYNPSTNTWTMGTGADSGASLNTWMPYTETATQVVVSSQNPNDALAFVNNDVFGTSDYDGNLVYYTAPGEEQNYDPFIEQYDQETGALYSPYLDSFTTLMMTTNGGATWTPVSPYQNPDFPFGGVASMLNQQPAGINNFYRFPGETVAYVGPFASSGEQSWGTFGPYTFNWEYQPSLVTDPVNGSRFLYGDEYPWYQALAAEDGGPPPANSANPSYRTLNETLNSGSSFNPVGQTASATTPVAPQQIALAGYQGPFQADPAFPLVTDQGANTDVPGTMYIAGPNEVTGQEEIYITRNYGLTWSARDLPSQALAFSPNATITDLEVDPSNSNVVYALVGGATGLTTTGPQNSAGRVWESSNGGQTWTPIGGVVANNDGLPDVSANKLVIDPRTGNLYVGTNVGVYEMAAGSSTWAPVGTGMPSVQVTDLYLNPNTNTLTASTYGQGVFQVTLSDITPNAGALTAYDGQTEWTGPIVLTGPTTISAQGSQSLTNNLSAAQLIITGSISDQTSSTTANSVTVGTPAGAGVVVFGGASTYTGTTDVTNGVLVADNFAALGSTQNSATVEGGAALQLAASLDAKPVILNGDGVAPGINGHSTGALEGVGDNVTFQGPITLASTEVTIGVDSGTSLTLTGVISGPGSLTKELTGTLILDGVQPNTYQDTVVNQGLLLIESSGALAPTGSVTVMDGAQVGLATPTDPTDPNFGASVTVDSTLNVAGTGIQNEGALFNEDGSNTWAGDINLDATPGFSPTTYPVGTVSIGVGLNGNVPDSTDVLTITGNITEAGKGLYSGLTKTGPDTLVLAGSDGYNGTTFINSGTVRVQNAQALGDPTDDPIQRVSVFDPGQNGSFTLSLTLNGQTQTTSAIPSGTDALTMANNVQSQVDTLLANLGAKNISVKVTGSSAPVQGSSVQEIILSVMFQGAGLAGLNLPQMVALAAGDTTAVESEVADNTYGTEVAGGAALQLDLANSPTGQTVNESVELNGTGPGTPVAITAASETGTTVTITTATPDGFQNGEMVTIDGISPPGYSGTFPITVLDATHFTYTAPASLGAATLSSAVAIPAIGHGALENLSGNNILTGTVNLQSSSSIGVDTNAVFPSQLTITGDVTGPWSSTLTKVGGATLGLAAANQYQGTTYIQTGVLSAQNNLALGGPLTDEVQTLTISGAFTGSYQLTFTDSTGTSTTGMISGSASAQMLQQVLATMLEAAPFDLSMAQAYQSVLVSLTGSVYTVTFTGVFAGMDLGNPGPLTLTPNSNTNGTEVDVATTVEGGQGNTIVSSGAALQLANNGSGNVHISTEQLILSGSGPNGNGALESVDGANSWDPNTQPVSLTDPTIADSSIILAGPTTIGVDADSSNGTPGLTIDQTINESVAGSQLTGAELTKTGAGTLLFSGTASNAYTGLTEVANGALELDKVNSTTPPATITAASESGTTVTITTSTPNGFQTGQFVSISGITPAGYNGTYQITVIDPTHFSYAAAGNLGTAAFNSATATPVVIDIPAGLQIGDGTGTQDSAVAQLEAPPSGETSAIQLGSTATLIILEDGSFDLNGQAQTVGNLNMTGGNVNLTNTSSSFTIAGGSVTATEDANGDPAVIEGGAFASGTFALGGTTPIAFNINAPATGPDLVDLDIQPQISGPEQLIKDGNGRMELDANSSTSLPTSIIDNNGDVQVDGDIGQISLAGGSVSGRGTIGVMDGAGGLGTPVVGTVAPGDNASIAPVGVLHNNPGNTSEQWGPSTVLSVDLTHDSSAAQPVAGTDYDQLLVNGGAGTNLALGGAQLSGTATANIQLGDQFTILEATGSNYISGKFAAPAGNDPANGEPIAYVGGSKFDVDYVSNGTPGEWSEVILIRTPQTAVLGVTSSLPNGASYGQDVKFTATVTIDNGLGSAPIGSTVTFILDKGTANQQTISVPVVNNQAVFDPAVQLNTPLSVGTHTVNAQFEPGNTNAINAPTAPQVTQAVSSAATITKTTLTSGSSFVYSSTTPVQVPVTVVPTLATVPNAVQPGSGDFVTLTLTNAATNTVVFTDKEPLGSPGNPANGYTFNLLPPTLGIGAYRVTVTYDGSANSADYQSSSVGPISFTVTQDVSTLTLSAQAAQTNSGTTSVAGQLVTFTAVIATNAPGTATPNLGTDTVSFTDNGNPLGTVPITVDPATGDYVAILQTSSLAVGQHTIRASYGGNSLLAGSSGQLNPEPFVVTVDNSQTILTANPSGNWSFGQAISFTATVLAVSPGTGIPTGTVTFYDGINSPSNPTMLDSAQVSSNGTVVFKDSGLATGPHDIYAVYSGSSSFSNSTSQPLVQSVLAGTTTGLSSLENPATVGNTVTFIATVTPNPASAGVPNGTVTFTDGNTVLQSGVSINSAGQYVYTTSSLAFGTHSIEATFVPAANSGFGGSTSSAITESIRSITSITLTSASPNPSAVGQGVTLTATVAGVPSANGFPISGIVSFYSGSVFMGQANVGAGGIATFTTPVLARGTYSFTASYGGNTLYAPSPTSTPISQTVVYASTTSLTISPNPATFAQTVTFTATVKAASGTTTGAGVPTGSVTFYDTISGTPVALNTVGLNTSNQAILTITGQNLGVGVHPIYAVYSGNGSSFAASTSATVKESVLSGTTTTLSSSGTLVSGTTYSSVYSQPVAFTAVVTPSSAGTVPTGTVTFKDGATTLTGGANIALVYNSAANVYEAVSPVYSALAVTTHSISAVYTPTAGTAITGSTGTMTERVTADPVNVTLTSSNSSSSYGQTVTLTATLANAPGTASLVNMGTVTFFKGTPSTPLASKVTVQFNSTNNDYEATFATAALPIGTSYTLGAMFVTSNANFTAGTNGSTTQTVGQVGTTTTVGAAASSFASGQTVTFTATVAPVVGSAVPTGSVQFTIDNGTPITGTPKGGGIWTLTEVATSANGLAFGSHTITAAYFANPSSEFANSDSTGNPFNFEILNGTQTSLQVSPTASAIGTNVTFTATVTSSAGTPTDGTVTFFDNGVAIPNSTFDLSQLGSNQVVFTTSSLPSGSQSITAQYSGDSSNFAASTSNAVTEVVYAVAASMTVSVTSPASHIVTPGVPFTLTALIYDSNGNLITLQPSGSQAQITIYKGTGPGTVYSTPAAETFTNGKFTFPNLVVGQGSYYIQITYDGITASYQITNTSRVS